MKQPYLSIYQEFAVADITSASGNIVSINCDGMTFSELLYNLVGQCQIFGVGSHPTALIEGLIETENLGIEIIHLYGLMGMGWNGMMEAIDFGMDYSMNVVTKISKKSKLVVPQIILSIY